MAWCRKAFSSTASTSCIRTIMPTETCSSRWPCAMSGGMFVKPVQLFAWHFMAYPHLPENFDETQETAWITVPNSLYDREKSRGLLNEYIGQLAYADTLGFDGMVLNEHHQNIYGLMPSPNLLAAALTQKTKHLGHTNIKFVYFTPEIFEGVILSWSLCEESCVLQ